MYLVVYLVQRATTCIIPNGDVVLASGCKCVGVRPHEVDLSIHASDRGVPVRPSVVEILPPETKAPCLRQLQRVLWEMIRMCLFIICLVGRSQTLDLFLQVLVLLRGIWPTQRSTLSTPLKIALKQILMLTNFP